MMRDYRDSKSMAHMLREALAAKHWKITVGESLELIAHLFGVADWNTLSALIKNADQGRHPPGRSGRGNGPRFAPTTEAALVGALRAAHVRGQEHATVEHLLLSLTEDRDATAIMKACAVDPTAIREILTRLLPNVSDGAEPSARDPTPSGDFQRAVQRAILDAHASGELVITGAHLLVGLLSEADTTAVTIVREHGLDRSAALKIGGIRGSSRG